MMRAAEIKVSGKVQGVFFRKYALQKAIALNLCGWVKNLPDGSLQILAEGTPEKLQQMIEWCHTGSPNARVDEVIVQPQSITGYSNFEIRK